MLFQIHLVAISALLHQAAAAPDGGELQKRVIATSFCFQDNLYRSFIDAKTSASASSFCSTYVRSTVSTAATTTTTVTAGVTKRGIQEKRALAATTLYPASRLSSACSCILTAKPTPTTVYTTTITSTVTSTASTSSATSTSSTTSTTSSPSTTTSTSTSSSSVPTTSSTLPTTSSTTDSSSSTSSASTTSSASSTTSSPSSTTSSTSDTTSTTSSPSCGVLPIVKNGDFETGSVAPWVVGNVYPGANEYLNYGVTKNGDNSVYAFTATDQAADSYVSVELDQTLNLCPGQVYNFAARYFMTDAYDGPQTYVIFLIDNTKIAQSKITDAHTPIRYVSLSGSFTAQGSTATLKAQFIATDYLEVTWGIDNVVITPA